MTQLTLIETPERGWSVNRLAAELRLDRRTVAERLRAAGVTPLGNARDGPVYALADAARAAFEAPSLTAKNDLELRRLTASTELAELELARRRAELVEVEQVVKAANALGRAEREAWTGWPARAGPALAAELGLDAAAVPITAALERLVRQQMAEREHVELDATSLGL